ncbi:PREDICTED: uncharacterized protein LOC108361965 [Rhagoletis zephyria]|uniref:uncharacterized protein LOC108361965 n=1 Tax=Rhagoletis zephyria TaxID=28612 RepID=UPI0008117031|nr:PREDICTED: uncharacterized protein LOC108361965 [Rhagoletis zephyria]XP_036340313.1 uncharacterized protein LOC118749615 [Rhagoletis pomonella]
MTALVSGKEATITRIASLFGYPSDGVFHSTLKLKNQFLYWPGDQDRKTLIAETLHELPYCIGYVDGTEVKLAEKPFQDPKAYFSRKHIYTLKVQGVCDQKLRIRHMVLGYSGSVHDTRVYNNCPLTTNTSEMLKKAEWLAGESKLKRSQPTTAKYF